MMQLDAPPSVGVSTQDSYEIALENWTRDLQTLLIHPFQSKHVVRAVTTTQTLRREQDGILLMDASGGARSVNLPPLDVVGVGWYLLVIKTDASVNVVTLDGSGAETINNAATNTQIDARYDRIGLVSTETEWVIVEREIAP